MRPRGNPSPILHRRPRKTVAAIRLLPLTGCRSSDILHPRRRDIGKEAINLPDSKPGPFAVPLSETARAPTEALPGHREPDTSLYPRHAEGRRICTLTNCHRTVCADAKLSRLRPRDLRPTVASQAAMAGETLPLVGGLLGHRRHRTTAGYTQIADAHLVDATERISCIILRTTTSARRSTCFRQTAQNDNNRPR